MQSITHGTHTQVLNALMENQLSFNCDGVRIELESPLFRAFAAALSGNMSPLRSQLTLYTLPELDRMSVWIEDGAMIIYPREIATTAAQQLTLLYKETVSEIGNRIDPENSVPELSNYIKGELSRYSFRYSANIMSPSTLQNLWMEFWDFENSTADFFHVLSTNKEHELLSRSERTQFLHETKRQGVRCLQIKFNPEVIRANSEHYEWSPSYSKTQTEFAVSIAQQLSHEIGPLTSFELQRYHKSRVLLDPLSAQEAASVFPSFVRLMPFLSPIPTTDEEVKPEMCKERELLEQIRTNSLSLQQETSKVESYSQTIGCLAEELVRLNYSLHHSRHNPLWPTNDDYKSLSKNPRFYSTLSLASTVYPTTSVE